MSDADSKPSINAKLFAALSAEALQHDPERAILLGMLALNAALHDQKPAEYAANRALRQAIWHSKLRLTLQPDNPTTCVPICAAWNNDGTQLVMGSDSGNVKAWNTLTGDIVWSFDLASTSVMACSPDGKILAIGGMPANINADSTVMLDAATGRLIKIMQSEPAFSLAWSPDSKRLAIGAINSACVYDVETGTKLMAFDAGPSRNAQVAWSPNGKYIATGSNGVQLWDANTGTAHSSLGPTRDVFSVAWSPDSRFLAVGLSSSGSNCAEIWNIDTATQRTYLGEFAFGGGWVAWSANGQLLAKGKKADGSVNVYALEEGKCLANLTQHIAIDDVSLAWHPKASKLATWSGQNGPRFRSLPQSVKNRDQKRSTFSVKVWDLNIESRSDGQEVIALKQIDAIRDAAWHPDGAQLGIICADICKIIDAQGGEELAQFALANNALGKHIDWSPDGTWLIATIAVATVGQRNENGNTIEVKIETEFVYYRIWNRTTGKELLTLSGNAADVPQQSPSPPTTSSPTPQSFDVSSMSHLRWSDNGERLTACVNKIMICVWEMPSQRLLLTLKQEAKFPIIELSQDGKRLTTSPANGIGLCIWDIDSGQQIRTIGEPDNADPPNPQTPTSLGAAWFPDGRRLISMTDDFCEVWNTDTGIKLTQIVFIKGIPAFCLSRDRKRIAIWVQQGIQTAWGVRGKEGATPSFTVWDTESGTQLPSPEFLKNQLYLDFPHILWSPNGEQFATIWNATDWFYGDASSTFWGDMDQIVRITDVASGKLASSLNAPSAKGLAWRPDGKRIACWYDNWIQIYAANSEELLELARTRVTRNFTFDECQRFFDADEPPTIP